MHIGFRRCRAVSSIIAYKQNQHWIFHWQHLRLGDEVLIEQSGAGKIEIVPASRVTLLNTSQYLSVTFGQYAIIGIKCVSNNTYVVTGEREPV